MTDEIINLINISLDSCLNNNNIFTDVPIIYESERLNKYSSLKLSKILVSFISQKIPSHMIDTYLDVLEYYENVNDITEIYNQKKIFKECITEEFSQNLLFNDNKQEIINNFQYLINNMFNDKISKYINDKKLKKDSIKFIYKGGTPMKILYNKYKNATKINQDIFNSYKNMFKRGDADYSIYIDKTYFSTELLYNQVLCDMNKISYNILMKVQDTFSKYLECFCPINNISNAGLKNLLQIINNKLKISIDTNMLPDLKIIKEFMGISINNKEYFKEKSVPINIIDTHIFKDKKNFDDNKNKQFLQTGKVSSQLHNFIIKIGEYMKDNEKRFTSHYCKLEKCNSNSIYYTFNETPKSVFNKKISDFNLHRLQINTILYYKTHDNKYGFFNCPSELVDVSISGFNEWKITNLNFKDTIKKYNYKNKYVFYSLSIYGFIEDIIFQLEEKSRFPWERKKYEKKIQRLIFFLVIYINKNIINNPNIFLNISQDFESLSFKTNNNNNIKYDKYNNHEIIIDIFKYLIALKKKVENNNFNQILKFNELINYFTKIKDFYQESNVNHETDGINGENIDMLQKYLKYKSKYIKLLTKINHT